MSLWPPGRVPASPPSPERCLSAALLQALGVVCVCTAIADPGWLLVRKDGENYVYGAAYVLHRGLNLTETGSHHLLHKKGLYILVLMAICCYISILLGFSAFLLDFLETRLKRLVGVKLSPILHFTTVLSSAAAVAECTYLYTMLYQEVHVEGMKPLPANSVTLGESYYFAICACVASLVATALSYYYSRKYRRGNHAGTPATPIEDTAPLLQEPESADPPGEYG